MTDRCNILIVGTGMAGAALAARLADWGRSVWLLDSEDLWPMGRIDRAVSAWDPAWQSDEEDARLSWASAALWSHVPGGFTPRPFLHLFWNGQLAASADMWARGSACATGVQEWEPSTVEANYPWLKANAARVSTALLVPAGAAGMVHGDRLYSHVRSESRRRSARVLPGESLVEASYGGGAWTVKTSRRTIRADVIINCAGAWADDVAKRCDTRRVGLRSVKRAALSLAVNGGADRPWRNSPFIAWHSNPVAGSCDIRPDGRAVVSPDMEVWAEPGDSEPSAEQIAAGLGQFESLTSLTLDETSGTSWAWLRSTVVDGRPVIGWARETPGFFWFAGLGNIGWEGIFSAAAIAADLVRSKAEFSWLTDQYGIRADAFSLDRLAYAGVLA